MMSPREEQTWEDYLRGREMTEKQFEIVSEHLDPAVRKVLRMLLDSIARETKTLDAYDKKLQAEYEHVRIMGETLMRAGLRSYTDKDGRIFVAKEPKP